MSLKVAICGAKGRVGSEVVRLLQNSDSNATFAGETPRDFKASLEFCDVVIDFSAPLALEGMLDLCIQEQKPLISGTTGLGEELIEKVRQTQLKIPMLWAPNMSLGIAIMKAMLKEFSRLDGFDFQLEEIHHNKKKDAPSGTAILLQSELQALRQDRLPPPISIRGGGVYGTHKFWAFSEEEILSIEHQALNRAVFARGALVAAHWIVRQPPGLYEMRHVLGLG